MVKLGGSLAESGGLRIILDIVGRAHVPLVIVPGGGEFADVVRNAQATFRFPDAVAHRMALLAMHQMGVMLKSLHPGLAAFETPADLRRALARDQIPLWLPLELVKRDGRISADWSTTSDGLAARLAERIGRVPVVLVKSCRITCGTPLAALVRSGVVDPTFAAIVERARLQWRVVGDGDAKELAELLDVRAKGAYRRRCALGDPSRRMASGRAIARRR